MNNNDNNNQSLNECTGLININLNNGNNSFKLNKKGSLNENYGTPINSSIK